MKQKKLSKDNKEKQFENNKVKLRFYAELNDYLSAERKYLAFNYQYVARETIQDALKHIGVPIQKIDLIIANGKSIGLSYQLKAGDVIAIYPTFELLDISQINQLSGSPLRNPRFILDVHLGKLAKYLRILGFDSYFSSDLTDSNIINIAQCEQRIILSKDKALLANPKVTRSYFVEPADPHLQIKEIVKKFDLASKMMPLTRCLICNHLLVPIKKEKISKRLEERTKRYMKAFNYCEHCDKVYWKGSHYQRMLQFCKALIV